jgi:hypothetical protein
VVHDPEFVELAMDRKIRAELSCVVAGFWHRTYPV